MASSMARTCGLMVADIERDRSCTRRSRRKACPGSVLEDSEERLPELVLMADGGADEKSPTVEEAGEVLTPATCAAVTAVSSCSG